MTRKVLALKPGDSILETITSLLQYDFDGIPVVDANRKVLGVVAERDLLYRIRNPQFATMVVEEGTYCD
ncbi:MAG: CBS domain-containing protein, partial [Armatimonadetes bacterium]|nr:CBS domain-containing protein [Armatimonadota bacterium]